MMTSIKKVLGIIIYTVVICVVLVYAPMEAKAISMPPQILDPFGDASVTISVSAEQVGATSAWDFHYSVYAASVDIKQINIGLVNLDTMDPYAFTIGAGDYSVSPATAMTPPVTDNSFLAYFLPLPLGQGSTYVVTVHFSDDSIFDGGQRFGVIDGGWRASPPLDVHYDKPVASVDAIPEPATMLLLGTGLVMLGLKRSRRKRE
jgi:hypothetical protein